MTLYVPAKEFEGELWVRVADFQKAVSEAEGRSIAEAEQQEPTTEKPYGYVRKDGNGVFIYGEHKFQNTLDHDLVPVYTRPREWQGLTDEEMRGLEKQFNAERVRTPDEEYLVIYPGDYWAWQRAIEAKLKEKNT